MFFHWVHFFESYPRGYRCIVSIGRAGSFVSNVLYCSWSARQGRNRSCFLVVTVALEVMSWLCFPRISVTTEDFKKGQSFISNRQRRKQGTFCASELAGIDPTPARSRRAGYARLNLSATGGIISLLLKEKGHERKAEQIAMADTTGMDHNHFGMSEPERWCPCCREKKYSNRHTPSMAISFAINFKWVAMALCSRSLAYLSTRWLTKHFASSSHSSRTIDVDK